MTFPSLGSRRLAAGLALLAILVASPALADEQIHEPIYPVKPSQEAEAEREEGTITVPDIVAEEGRFHLAVIDQMQAKVDNRKVLEGVRDIMEQSNAKIVVGVDTANNGMEGGAAQFVRALTMFGPTSYLLLHDDWPDSVKSKGYVEDGWIVIGLMFPEESGKGGELAIDKAWNIKGDRATALKDAVAAVRPGLDEGDYTQAIVEAVRATTTELTAPVDLAEVLIPQSTAGKLAVAGAALAVLAAAGVFLFVLPRVRAGRREKQVANAARLAELRSSVPHLREKLARSTLPVIPLPAESTTKEYAALFLGAQAAIEPAALKALEVQPMDLAVLQRTADCQQALLAAFDTLQNLVGRARLDQRRWNAMISTHQQILQDSAHFLDDEQVASLEPAAPLRLRLVTDTDVLEEVRQLLARPQFRSVEPAQMLDQLWDLRIGLMSELAAATTQAKQKGVKIPGEIAAHLELPEGPYSSGIDDLARLEYCAQQVKNWQEPQGRANR